ncbi:MAG: hypothetical protein LBB21_03420 [Holosporaceae bacterium]|jgi:hypothetical protein|nr:hypothetical protein [Holosporaceae bacterium]
MEIIFNYNKVIENITLCRNKQNFLYENIEEIKNDFENIKSQTKHSFLHPILLRKYKKDHYGK